MSDKEFNALEDQVEKLVKLSKQLKESNTHLLKKNVDLAKREKELTMILNTSKGNIRKLINKLKNK
tara:strand:+ start:165 stop:362 length:198 start_codon:yes stop_codon:yes gene_type:complete